jgi:hypothetical protein
VELAWRRYHQTRWPLSPLVKLINGRFGNARIGMGFDLHVLRQRELDEVHECLLGHFGIVHLVSFRMDL